MDPFEIIAQIEELEREIAGFPPGGIAVKTVNGKQYFYHRITRNKKRTETYIHADQVESLRAQIEERKKVEAELKKKLSDRMYKLADGTWVQRDWYSSFLLYCYDDQTKNIDKKKCVSEFNNYYEKEKTLIEWIKVNKIKILNSGIKIA